MAKEDRTMLIIDVSVLVALLTAVYMGRAGW